jgi:hypothetical protein
MAIYDPDKIFDALETAAEEWANADYDARRLENLQKSRLAQITLAKMQGKSKAQAELEALADPEYMEWIEGMVTAKKIAIRAKAKYDDYKVLADGRRTQESSQRELIR